MKYVAAYALLVLGGKENPTEDDIKKLLAEVGAEVDGEKLKQVVASLKGKKLADLIAEGQKQVASLSFGGAAQAAAPVAAVAAPVAAKAAPPKKEEKVEEEDVGMGGLFD